MEKKRSVGVTTLGIVLLVVSIALLAYITVISMRIGFWTIRGFIVTYCFPIALLASAVGILRLKNWARVLLIVTLMCWLFFGCFGVYLAAPQGIGGWLYFFAGNFLPLLVFGYFFTRPAVKAQFK